MIKTVIALSTLVFVMNHETAATLGTSAFHTDFWFADGVAVGRVAAVDKLTLDIEIQEWMRDRTEGGSTHIRAYRFSRPSCVPGTGHSESYAPDARYLFMMRQPFDAKGAQTPYWEIISQFLLDGARLCLTTKPNVRVEKVKGGCEHLLREEDLLDAARTFEQCFELYDDPILGTFPSRQICSKQALETWGERSVLHGLLANVASDVLNKKTSRGASNNRLKLAARGRSGAH